MRAVITSMTLLLVCALGLTSVRADEVPECFARVTGVNNAVYPMKTTFGQTDYKIGFEAVGEVDGEESARKNVTVDFQGTLLNAYGTLTVTKSQSSIIAPGNKNWDIFVIFSQPPYFTEYKILSMNVTHVSCAPVVF